jgi:flagellin-specific chaperone FliS
MAGAASGEPTPAEPVATPGAPASIAELAAEANRHFENARRALQAGNWAQYGEDMKRVEEILAEIQRIVR